MKKAVVYIVALGVACTVLGGIAGSAITKAQIKKNLPKIVRQHLLRQGRGAHRGGAGNPLGQIGRELNLSEEQLEQIKPVLEEAKAEIEQAAGELKERIARIKEESHAHIAEFLGPEQQERLQELTERAKERGERRFRRWSK